MTARRLRLWGTALAVVGWTMHLQATWGTTLLERAGTLRAADYVQFFVSGSMLLRGEVDGLYRPERHVEEGRRRIGAHVTVQPPLPNYGPQVAAAFAPLATLPFTASLILFSLKSAASYALAIGLLMASFPTLRRYQALVLVLAAGYPAFPMTLRFGQLSTFSLCLCALATWALARERQLTCGLALGLLAFKPPLAALALTAALLAGRWRVVAGALLGMGFQAVIALAVAGPEAIRDYLGVLAALAAAPDKVVLFPESSHSIRGFLRLLGTPPVWASALTLGAFVSAASIGAWLWRTSSSTPTVFAWLVGATVLTSPHLLTYDLLLLAVPTAAFAAMAASQPSLPHWSAVVGLLVGLYFAPFSSALVARHTGIQISTVLLGWLVVVGGMTLWRRNRRRA